MAESSGNFTFHITTSGCSWFSRHWTITSGSDKDKTPAYFVTICGFFKPTVEIRRKDASGPVIGTVRFHWKPHFNVTLTPETSSSGSESEPLETTMTKTSLGSPYTVSLYDHNFELRQLSEGTKPFSMGNLKLIDVIDGKVWAKFYSERMRSWNSIGRIDVLENGLEQELVDAVIVILITRIQAQNQER